MYLSNITSQTFFVKNSSPRVDMPLLWDAISWCPANQSLFLLLNAAILAFHLNTKMIFYLCTAYLGY